MRYRSGLPGQLHGVPVNPDLHTLRDKLDSAHRIPYFCECQNNSLSEKP